MRLFKIFVLLLSTSIIGKGQEKSPYQINTCAFSVKINGNEFEIDQKKYCSQDYYNEDGTDRTSEELGFIEIPEVLKYDEHGNIIERNQFSPNGSLVFRMLYTYDSLSRMIESRWEDEQCNLMTRDEIEYDQYGNKIRSEKFEDDAVSVRKTIYQYDTLNNQIKFTEYKKGKVDLRYTHKYDGNDNLIEVQWLDSLGQFGNKTIFEYNEKNDLLKECTLDKDDNLMIIKTFDYTFDQYGSWIEKRHYLNDSLIVVTRREITYYE